MFAGATVAIHAYNYEVLAMYKFMEVFSLRAMHTIKVKVQLSIHVRSRDLHNVLYWKKVVYLH